MSEYTLVLYIIVFVGILWMFSTIGNNDRRA